MGLKAKSSIFREFCENCMKSLWLPVYNANNEIFSKYNLILTEKSRKKEENIVACGMLQFSDAI